MRAIYHFLVLVRINAMSEFSKKINEDYMNGRPSDNEPVGLMNCDAKEGERDD